MLAFLRTVSTLLALLALGEHIIVKVASHSDDLSPVISGTCCFNCAFGTTFSSSSAASLDEHFVNVCLTIDKLGYGGRRNQEMKMEMFIMNSTLRKSRCQIAKDGNYRSSARILTKLRRFSRMCVRDGERDRLQTKCFLNTEVRIRYSNGVEATCMFKLNNTSHVGGNMTSKTWCSVMNIDTSQLIISIRVLIKQVVVSNKSLIGLYKPCKISRLLSMNKTKIPDTQRAAGPPDKRLRIRRDIFITPTYSTYFAHDSSHSSQLLRATITPSRTMIAQPLLSHGGLPECPEITVVNSSTIFLTRSTPPEHFQKTLVPTAQLTRVPRALFLSPVTNDTAVSSYMLQTASQTTLITPSTISNVTTTYTSHDNATYIYNSSLLVSIVSSAQNSSYVVITTWDCVRVSKTIMRPPLSNSILGASTTTVAARSDEREKNMKLVISLAVTGGLVLALIVIVVFVALVRRYRRSHSERRKKKQISYFNRYDRSSAWDDEPFGGSRLSVFTLKNSKFDIADWESTDGKKQDDRLREDYENR